MFDHIVRPIAACSCQFTTGRRSYTGGRTSNSQQVGLSLSAISTQALREPRAGPGKPFCGALSQPRCVQTPRSRRRWRRGGYEERVSISCLLHSSTTGPGGASSALQRGPRRTLAENGFFCMFEVRKKLFGTSHFSVFLSDVGPQRSWSPGKLPSSPSPRACIYL